MNNEFNKETVVNNVTPVEIKKYKRQRMKVAMLPVRH